MTQTLTLEEEGALTRLVRAAWRDTVPCTLYDSPVLFERLLGARYKKFRALIDQHFTPDPELPGRLRCQWLTLIYVDQAHRYRKRVERNERHRVKLAEKLAKLRRLEAEEEETQGETHQETHGETSPETHDETHRETLPETSHETANRGVETSPPLRAKSLELRGASPLDLKIQGQEAPALDRALGAETPRAASSGTTAGTTGATSEHERAYWQRLKARAESFAQAHPERYEEVVAAIRLGLALPRGRPVPNWYKQQFDDAVLVAVRQLHPDWPQSADEWHPEPGESGESGDEVAA